MAKTEKVTAKSVICSGIKAGKSINFILGQVQKKIPSSNADEKHIKHYAGVLVRDGEMKLEDVEKYGYKQRGAALKGKKKTTEEKPAAKKAPAKKATKKAAEEKPAAKKAVTRRKKASADEKPAAKKTVAKKKSGSEGGTKVTRKRASKK